MNNFFKNALIIVVGFVLFAIVSVAGKNCGKAVFGKDLSTKSKVVLSAEDKKQLVISSLKEAEKEFKKKCPFMIDEATRFDRFEFEYPKAHYYFSLVRVNKELLPFITIEDMKNRHRKAILGNLKTLKNLRVLLMQDITIFYFIRDKSGNHIYEIILTKDDL